MQAALYALLALVPWVAVTLLLRLLIAMEGWPVGLVGSLSRLVTVPLLAVWILATGAGWRRLRPRGRGGWLLLMGAISIVINFMWFGAVQWTTATNVAMLIRLDVVFVILLGALLGLERIGLAQLALAPVMLVGLSLLVGVEKLHWGGSLPGDLMTIVAALGLAVNAFVIRHIMLVMDEESVALYNHSISALGFVVAALAGGEFVRTAEVFGRSEAWLPIAVLGVLAAVSLPLYYVALRRMDVWKLRMFMLFGPLLTVLVEWPLWGAPLSGRQWLGGAIILVGLAALIRFEARLAAALEKRPAEAASRTKELGQAAPSRRDSECVRD